VYRHVLKHWQAKASVGVAKWHSLAKALCFQKQQLLNKALQAWAEGIQHQQEVRTAADVAFRGVAHRQQLQSTATVLQAWMQAAQVQAHHRQLLTEAESARQQRIQQQVSMELWLPLLGIGSPTGQSTVFGKRGTTASVMSFNRQSRPVNVQVLHHWRQLVLYHQQLAAATQALQQVQPRWWLVHSFWRWRAVVQVLAGQRGDELRELVQLRACLG
jgi:hypothetical protein